MPDRPPPSRYSVVERGGRLVVIDRESGTTPPTAAERMAAYDARMGHEPIRPAKKSESPDLSDRARSESGLSARPAPVAAATAPDIAPRSAAPAQAGGIKQPWNRTSGDRPALKSDAAPARIASRPSPSTGAGRRTIVTGKWWDAKGPRTIELSAKGQAELRQGFAALIFMLVAVAVVTAFIAPALLFIGGILLLRFTAQIIGPIGASLIDKALAARG